MNLSQNRHVIKHGTEGSAPIRKKVNIGRYIYFSLLLLSILYISRLFFYNFYQIKGTGIITIPSYSVIIKKDSVISDLNLSIGQNVHTNQLLFNTKSEDFYSKNTLNQDKIFNLKLDIFNLKYKIKSIKSKSNQNNILYSLDLYNKKNIDDNKDKLHLYKYKLKLLNDNLKNLIFIQQKSNSIQRIFEYLSPIDGIINTIDFKNKDFVLKGQKVLTISQNTNAYILGYFDAYTLKDIKIGKNVDIVLPNNDIIYGKISDIQSASTDNSLSSQLKVKIIIDNHFINNFNKMPVKLKVYKWNLLH